MRLRIGGTILHINLPSISGRPWSSVVLALVVFCTLYYISSPRHTSEDGHLKGKHIRDLSQKRGADSGGDGAGEGPINDPMIPLRSNRLNRKQVPGLRIPMAMDDARSRWDVIQKIQKDILANQVRPSDDVYNINVTLSDTVSMDRSLPDTRPQVCRTFTYNRETLGTATIIIPFYNEALSMILRTLHSILSRTPNSLLDEIILVDDCSTREYLHEPLERYVRLLPKVTLVRNEHRDGLIRSRMTGARMAKSPVVIFQDAHTECNVGWLEPLLIEIQKHPKNVVQPFVDGIDRLTLEFTAPPTYYRGAFSWDLRYTWLRVPDHEHNRAIETGEPFFTPTLVGCAMAVNKEYFLASGSFDEGLNVWGGENIELGFRTWMCGGRVVTVTCSRVGHVFKEFPYKFDGDKEVIVQKNLIRVAETWMDGVKKYFYAATRVYEFKRAELTSDEQKSLQERIDLRKKLKCKNFEWYMYNIAPEIEVPPMEAVYYGEIMSLETRACWEVLDDYYIGMTYFCFEHKIIPKNNFALTSQGLLKYRDKCVRVEPPSPIMTLAECPPANDQAAIDYFGVWELKNKGHVWGNIKVKRRNKDGVWEKFCVIQVTNVLEAHHKEQMPQIGSCDDDNKFSIWSWTYKFDWQRVPNAALTKYSVV